MSFDPVEKFSFDTLKPYALFLDAIGGYLLEDYIEFGFMGSNEKELNCLLSSGFLYPQKFVTREELGTRWEDEYSNNSAYRELIDIYVDLYKKANSFDVDDMETSIVDVNRANNNIRKFTARRIVNELRIFKEINAVDIGQGAFSYYKESNNNKYTNAEVVSLAIKTFPIIDQKMSWDDIIQFRSEKENKEMLNRYRLWLSKMLNKGVDQFEILEEIECLMADYKKYMDICKIRYHLSAIEVCALSTAQFVENMAKFRISDAMKSIFIFSSYKAKLLECELKAPGREVAYLVNVANSLSKQNP